MRAHLKVQDGCSLSCAYCRPSQVRGAARSKSVAAASDEARRLVERGYPEIVLTGINLAQYASDDGGLPDLVRAVLRIGGIRRLRLGSINPYGLTDALLAAFAEDERACPHFHVPLQSGDDRILHAMRRGYTLSDYKRRIARARRELPGATFGADLLVGFPGEDDEAFERTCRAVLSLRFSNAHIFRYSPRAGTEAAHLPRRVPEPVKRERAARLDSVCRTVRSELLDNRIAETQDVLVEASRNGQWRGYTRDYLHVHFHSESKIPLGTERAVRITAAAVDHLRGEDAGRDGTG
jgi:threonylcarbamoyladenosine tRNA methylthiotransferase MtaB